LGTEILALPKRLDQDQSADRACRPSLGSTAHVFSRAFPTLGGWNHGQDRVVGSAKVVKGKLKEAVGKVVGDAKCIKDTLRGK
jgi:hypothetical protein